jgi:ADP-ribosyl-[dinitrogen reductase] hydrolase
MRIMSSTRPTAERAPPRPLPGSYWVVPRRLLVGEYPGSRSRADAMERLKRVLAAGVTLFIDLTDVSELPSYESLLPFATPAGRRVEYQRETIADHGVPSSPEVMSRILDTLRAALANGQVVYVHCRAGIGRSAMAAGCYLVEQGMTADQALAELQTCWQQSSKALDWICVPETDEQYEYIRAWAQRRDRTAATTSPSPSLPATAAAPLAERSALHSRVRGAWLGLAIGDLLGAARGAPPDRPGDWTQHTSLAICAAESLLSQRGFDAKDQMERFLRWKRDGHHGDRVAPAVSEDVSRALATYRWRGLATAGSHDPQDRSGASLSRAVPAALYAFPDPAAAVTLAAELSRTTHQGPIVLDACRYYAAMLVGALRGGGVAVASGRYEPIAGLWQHRPLKQEIEQVATAEPLAGTPPKRPTESNVLATLTNVRRVLMLSSDFETIVNEAVRTALDPALDGALSGALAGAALGSHAIPAALIARVPDAQRLTALIAQCLELHERSVTSAQRA